MISYTINVHADTHLYDNAPRPVVVVQDLAGCDRSICLRIDDLTIFCSADGLRDIQSAIGAYFDAPAVTNKSFGGGLESEQQPVEAGEQSV